MIYERARQIMQSPETIEVRYKDKSVWIDRVNPEGRTADVSTKTRSYTVPVQELTEHELIDG